MTMITLKIEKPSKQIWSQIQGITSFLKQNTSRLLDFP